MINNILKQPIVTLFDKYTPINLNLMPRIKATSSIDISIPLVWVD